MRPLPLLTTADWDFPISLSLQDTSTGAVTPAPVAGIPFSLNFVQVDGGPSMGQASTNAGTLTVVDPTKGLLRVLITRASRSVDPTMTNGAAVIYGDLMAVETISGQPLTRWRGRVAMTVKKGT